MPKLNFNRTYIQISDRTLKLTKVAIGLSFLLGIMFLKMIFDSWKTDTEKLMNN